MKSFPFFRLFGLPFGSKNAKSRACAEVANAESVSQVGAALNKLTEAYYTDVLRQAKWSFACALAASIVATFLFFKGIYSLMDPFAARILTKIGGAARPDLSIIAGALVEVLAGINFYLYSRTSRQFSSFHICLERANRFLLVDKICDTLPRGGEQEAMRKKLIEAMLRAPMLTVAEVTGVVESSNQKHNEGGEPAPKRGRGSTGSNPADDKDEEQ